MPSSTFAAVVVTGIVAVIIAAPGYLILDTFFSPYTVDSDPEPAAGNLLSQLLWETVELSPWFLATWLLINLPVLLPPPRTAITMNDQVVPVMDRVVDEGDFAISDQRDHQPAVTAGSDSNSVLPVDPESSFLLSLPGIIGSDLIAVSSDLHYLNVWTSAGRTTVLGKLRDVVNELDDAGMQVHRSHWVAHSHVRRIVGNAGNAACILSNELRIPVSRRRWKTVREYYGRGVVHSDQETR